MTYIHYHIQIKKYMDSNTNVLRFRVETTDEKYGHLGDYPIEDLQKIIGDTSYYSEDINDKNAQLLLGFVVMQAVIEKLHYERWFYNESEYEQEVEVDYDIDQILGGLPVSKVHLVEV